MSAVLTDAIRLAFPDARAKRIANALGVSIITGKRIASSGHVSKRLRTALVDLLDREIQKNELRLRQLRRQLQEIDHETAQDMAGRPAADGMGSVPPEGEGPC